MTNQIPDPGHQVAAGFRRGPLAVDDRGQLAEGVTELGPSRRDHIGELVRLAERLERTTQPVEVLPSRLAPTR